MPTLHDKHPDHTVECKFEYFLSYSGLYDECADVKAKLLLAFRAGGELPITAQEA
ncbi:MULTISPECIES: hypothetical protein [Pseudomonas syringae group]|uniref:hypothetical protein n=1 Tax=Pseudomonas syringae group TaxID=136849 RepID=UPI0013158550|nr:MULTISPECIES: hypothetical protein [Pseudomonas syringae group]MBI6848623.1 hypothetical protein [Pseudomonas syringae]